MTIPFIHVVCQALRATKPTIQDHLYFAKYHQWRSTVMQIKWHLSEVTDLDHGAFLRLCNCSVSNGHEEMPWAYGIPDASKTPPKPAKVPPRESTDPVSASLAQGYDMRDEHAARVACCYSNPPPPVYGPFYVDPELYKIPPMRMESRVNPEVAQSIEFAARSYLRPNLTLDAYPSVEEVNLYLSSMATTEFE